MSCNCNVILIPLLQKIRPKLGNSKTTLSITNLKILDFLAEGVFTVQRESGNFAPKPTEYRAQCWEFRSLLFVSGLLDTASIGKEKRTRTFFAHMFCTPAGVRDIPANFPGHPRFLSSKPMEEKLSKEGTNFSVTHSRGRPPPHRAVSRPKKVYLCALFFFPASNLFLIGG